MSAYVSLFLKPAGRRCDQMAESLAATSSELTAVSSLQLDIASRSRAQLPGEPAG